MTMRAVVTALRLHLRLLRMEQLVLPAGLWALFVLLTVFLPATSGQRVEAATSFLGIVLPMLGGILASSLMVDDPAIELQFAAPRRAWRTLIERLAVLFGVVTVAAVLFQAHVAMLGLSLDRLGGIAGRQLAWLVPSVALMALSSVVALLARHAITGAMLVGLVWMMQIALRGRMLASWWAQHLFLFMGARHPDHPALARNQMVLVGLAFLLTLASARLLRHEERYL